MTSHDCTHCGTELPPDALACPGCGALIHAATLKQVAAEAEEATRSGSLLMARTHWTKALELLPAHSQQHAVIRGRIADLTARIGTATDSSASADKGGASWWTGLGGLGAIALLLATKAKFLLLGLTKASTFVSMFAFFGVYWSLYGWPLAGGLVLSIYIHEMGHVAMLRRLGIESGAPLFIPGVGAVVMLRQHITDPLTDAKIGLAGPVWGLGAGLTAALIYALTGAPIWFAIAQLTGFLNLFNLIPVWQLDGSRGMHALARTERWVLVGAIAVALLLTEQRLLFIVGAVAVWRAMQKEQGPGDARVLATFVALVFALSLLARGVN
ncbi:MAG TPA: zinc-ribbon domain-containing protein [Vicinamibacterales bacterium]|nr:zinc-ribbon domain-containing protein [Vicinamibacterales bacterium]